MRPHTSRKPSPQAQHALIRKYNISIEGPIRRRDWPGRYAPIFSIVRDLEKIQYDEYCTTGYTGDNTKIIHVSNMCNRVEKLVRKAHGLRDSLDNEETWRLETEHLILERFKTDVNCHLCADRRWISDFQAIPSCPVSGARLQSARKDRRLCQCSEVMRAKLLAEQPSQSFFVTKGSCTFVDRSMVEIQKKMLAHHKPDRVLGLGRTDELQHLLGANPNILATVVGDEMDMYFPFLVLEAKSEKNSVGFESIERQTVFPIRAMLALQRSLEAASSVKLDPLVWFLANRGDEWRVYACVVDHTRIRIIDLWHGSILRHDSALQLLLVIDLLCDWARDIYMEQIMSILQELAGPDFPRLYSQNSVEVLPPMQLQPRDTRSPNTPRASPQPAQSVYTPPTAVVKPEIEDMTMDAVPHISVEETSSTGSAAPSLFMQRHISTEDVLIMEPPSPSPSTRPHITTEDTSITEPVSPRPSMQPYLTTEDTSITEPVSPRPSMQPYLTTEETSTTDPATPTSFTQPIPSPWKEQEFWDMTCNNWSKHVAIRSYSAVQLRFRSLSLPESAYSLSVLLREIDAESDTAQTALKLLDLFNLADPFITEPHFIDRIRRVWGEPDAPLRPKGQPLIYACLHWRASFDYSEWKITKEFACIMASQVAITALARISNVPTGKLSLGVTSTKHAPRLVHPLHHLPLPELVQAASKSQFLHLKVSNGHATTESWTEDVEKAAFAERLWQRRDLRLDAFQGCHDNVYSVAPGIPHFYKDEHEVEILPLLHVPGIAKERRFALLRQPPAMEGKEPLYCIFPFETRHLSSPSWNGKAIRSFLREGSGCFYGSNLPHTALDREQLGQVWGALMNVDLAATSPRPCKRARMC